MKLKLAQKAPKIDQNFIDQHPLSNKVLVFTHAPLRASSLRSPAFLTNSPPDCLSVSAAIRQWSLAPDTKICAAFLSNLWIYFSRMV